VLVSGIVGIVGIDANTGSLAVDEDRAAVSVDQHMVQAQLAVHDGVLGPQPNLCGQLRPVTSGPRRTKSAIPRFTTRHSAPSQPAGTRKPITSLCLRGRSDQETAPAPRATGWSGGGGRGR